MTRIKRARAATGSSEASVPEPKPNKKRIRPRKSQPESDEDAMIGVENIELPKPIPEGGVEEVEETDSSSSEEKDPSDSKEKDESESEDDSDYPGGLLACLTDEEVEKAKPKGTTNSPSERPPSPDEMDEYVEENDPNKKSAELKSKGGDKVEKPHALPLRKIDKGKGKAITTPIPDSWTTGGSMHAPNRNNLVLVKTGATKPIASTSRTPAAAGPSRISSK